MQITKMYYDRFFETYTVDKSDDAPPERYYEIDRGLDGVYIERWANRYGERLDIAYAEEDYCTEKRKMIYEAECMQCEFEPKMIVCISAPKHVFDEYVLRYGLDKEVGHDETD